MQYCPDSALDIIKEYPTVNVGTYLRGRSTQDTYGAVQGKVYICVNNSYHLACCGASGLTNLSSTFDTEKELQSFVAALRRSIFLGQTYYAIAATYQTKGEGGKFGNTCTALLSLGAEEVDRRPNRYHGPHDMHMLVWNPDKADWSKYLGPYHFNPLWWDKLSADEQNKEIAQSAIEYEAYAKAQQAKDEANKKARMHARIWQSFYDARDGRLNERLVQHGFKPVEKANERSEAERARVQKAGTLRSA